MSFRSFPFDTFLEFVKTRSCNSSTIIVRLTIVSFIPYFIQITFIDMNKLSKDRNDNMQIQ